jgi:hypothetical protein
MNLGKIINTVKYSYLSFPNMGEYFNEAETVVRYASQDMLKDIEVNEKNGAKRVYNEVYKSILSGRQIIDCSRQPDVILPVFTNVRNIKCKQRIDGLSIFPGIKGVFNIVIKNQRSAITEIGSVAINTTTQFNVMSSLNAYGKEKYSIALIGDKRGFALIAGQSKEGIKGKGVLKVTAFDADNYYIDDASKYIDVRPFLYGLT